VEFCIVLSLLQMLFRDFPRSVWKILNLVGVGFFWILREEAGGENAP